MVGEPNPRQERSLLATGILLVGLALVIRLGVFGAATAFGPADSLGDTTFHAQLVDGPIDHLRHSSNDVAQYAPYLGLAEWLTAKPWLAVGTSEVTALRLSSITWDLVGMVLVLVAAAVRFPRKFVFVGLMWAASPLLWPASAYSAQDEPISAAVVAGAVLLLCTRRRAAAVALCVAGLFLTKVLLLPVAVAFLLTAPRRERARAWAAAAATAVVAVAVTWALSGTDGLRQQVTYTTDVVGFSISFWSTLVLHQVLEPVTAIHVSIVVVAVGLAGVVAVWWRYRSPLDGEDILDGPRLAAAFLFVTFAVLGVSNPEYLAIAAPVAILGCIGMGAQYQAWLLVAVSGTAWAVNGVYYLLRKAYDPTGTQLVVNGFDRPVDRTVHGLDAGHQFLLAAFFVGSVILAVNYAIGPRRLDPSTAEPPTAEPPTADDRVAPDRISGVSWPRGGVESGPEGGEVSERSSEPT